MKAPFAIFNHIDEQRLDGTIPGAMWTDISRRISMGVVLPSILIIVQGLSFSPYWVRVRGDAYGPLYSRQRDVLGNVENVYIQDYHLELYNPFLAVLICSFLILVSSVLFILLNIGIFDSRPKGRKASSLFLAVLVLLGQVASLIVPAFIHHNSTMLWTYYMSIVGAAASVILFGLTLYDFRCDHPKQH